MYYGVARSVPTGREFAGFESVDGGVRGILGFRHQLSATVATAMPSLRTTGVVAGASSPLRFRSDTTSIPANACNLNPITAGGSPRGVSYTSRVSSLVQTLIR